MGTDVNLEKFLSLADSNAYKDKKSMINDRVWNGAANVETYCGDPKRYISMSVSCLANSVVDRVRECRAGRYSPDENLLERNSRSVYITIYDDDDDKPAPCEIRPSYCNRRAAPTPI